MVVCISMWVSSHLLTLTGNSAIIISERILVRVTVKIPRSFLVLNLDVVVVVDRNSVGSHQIVTESLLKLRRHEIVTRTGSIENRKVHLEPEQVEKEWDDNQCDGSRCKMLAEFGKAQSTLAAINIQETPEVDCNRRTNGYKCEQANIFGRNDAAQGESGKEEPLPPLTAEWFMA